MTALRRPHFLTLALLYALGAIYSSLILGPAGLHYVPTSLGEAWHRFLAIQYVEHGSDQRADWIANMMMPIPLAYLVNAVLDFRRGRVREWGGSAFAFLLCLAFILAVKYAQLFFPPRTVTLNYVTAQAIGAALGVVAFRLSHTRLYPALVHQFDNGEGLTIVLGGYTLWLISFFLMPFNFVLGLGDVIMRALDLPSILFSFPGEGRQFSFRVLMLIADTLATVPVGMFLAITGRGMSRRALLLRGLAFIVVITLLTLLVMSATPFLIAIVYRMVGIYAGIRIMETIRGKDLRKRHYYLSRYVPGAFAVYLVFLVFVSELFTSEWSTLSEATNALEPRQFLPFWNFYIVSKARASESVVEHLALYAPIGVMIWIRRGFWAKGAVFSAVLAFLLAMLMELGRWMKPGLRPDFSDPIVAAIGAAAAFAAMPYLWRMFEREATMTSSLDTYIADMRRAAEAAPAVATENIEAGQPSAPVA